MHCILKNILFLSRDQNMKCSTYASAEALDPVSFPCHGASLEGNLLCFGLFNQAYVGFKCGQCKFH